MKTLARKCPSSSSSRYRLKPPSTQSMSGEFVMSADHVICRHLGVYGSRKLMNSPALVHHARSHWRSLWTASVLRTFGCETYCRVKALASGTSVPTCLSTISIGFTNCGKAREKHHCTDQITRHDTSAICACARNPSNKGRHNDPTSPNHANDSKNLSHNCCS